jgi:hypothetical protein
MYRDVGDSQHSFTTKRISLYTTLWVVFAENADFSSHPAGSMAKKGAFSQISRAFAS